MTDFKVAIVGNGGIYRLAHGPAWRRLPRASVVATCDVIEERAEQARVELGAEDHFTRIEALLEKGGIDIVDICAPSDTHAELTIQCLRAGKHVICEKPMALSTEDASRMMRTAAEVGRQLHIGHTRRFDPRWVRIKEQIAAGRIGEPVSVRRSERCWGGFPTTDWHWDLNRSGGVLMDLGVHIADLFTWFLDARPVEVYAKALTIRKEAQESGCFDFGTVQVGYANGKRGLMEVSWAHPAAYAPFYSTTEVIGTRGKITFSDRDTSPMTIVKKAIDIPRFSSLLSSFPETFVEELDHFLDCVEGKARPRIDMNQARNAVHIINAAFQSIASGQPVRVSEGDGDA